MNKPITADYIRETYPDDFVLAQYADVFDRWAHFLTELSRLMPNYDGPIGVVGMTMHHERRVGDAVRLRLDCEMIVKEIVK